MQALTAALAYTLAGLLLLSTLALLLSIAGIWSALAIAALGGGCRASAAAKSVPCSWCLQCGICCCPPPLLAGPSTPARLIVDQ